MFSPNPINVSRTRMEMPAHLEALVHKPINASKFTALGRERKAREVRERIEAIRAERRHEEERLEAERIKRKKLEKLAQTIRAAQKARSNASPNYLKHPQRMQRLFNIYSQVTGVSKSTILQKTRQKHCVLARQRFAFIVRRCMKMAYPQIARRMGGFDHSTIVYAVQKINADPKLFADAVSIESEVLVKEAEIYGQDQS